MNEYERHISHNPRENVDRVPKAEPLSVPRDLSDLPISNWDDYKNWCEKVKQNWDVN